MGLPEIFLFRNVDVNFLIIDKIMWLFKYKVKTTCIPLTSSRRLKSEMKNL